MRFVEGSTCFPGDEADELRHAFLNCLFCVLGDFPVGGNHFFHDSSNVGYGEKTVLFFVAAVVVMVCGRGAVAHACL
ncbi:hypothetical protein CR513_47022, partial [Mucuna pruriens]